MNLSANTERVLEALNRIAVYHPTTFAYDGMIWSYRYTAEVGQVRDRIVQQSTLHSVGTAPDFAGEQRSVRCFVERAEGGDILYSGSWTSPAKWKNAKASEFSVEESELYAQFTRDGGWGYKGDRKRWEAKQ